MSLDISTLMAQVMPLISTVIVMFIVITIIKELRMAF